MAVGRSNDFLGPLTAQIARRRYYTSPDGPLSSLSGRLEIADFVKTHLPEIAARAAAQPGPPTERVSQVPAMPIFMYWGTGFERAPAIVRACAAQLRRVHPDALLLDAGSVRELIDVPEPVAAATEADYPAQFSDFLRVALLERYGGIWVDATCWVPSLLRAPVGELLSAGVLFPRWTPNQISNWFVAALPGNRLISMLRAGLEIWWERRGTLPDYFLFHRIFSSLESKDSEVHRIWKAVPTMGSLPCHYLQAAMYRQYDAQEVAVLVEKAIVQKLSHKFDAQTVPEGSILARILSGRPLEERPSPEPAPGW
jgi:hypothetical protein